MTTFDTTSLDALRDVQQQLNARLSHFRRQVRMRLVLEGAAIVLTELFGAAIFTLLADHTFRLNVGIRVTMLVVIAALFLVECWRRIVTPLRLRMGLVALAGAIDHQNPNGPRDLAARVASILELPRLMEGPHPPSATMIEHAVRRAHKSLASVRFEAALDQKRLQKMLAIGLSALLLPAILAIFFPGITSLWAKRLFLASHDPWPQNTYLEIADAVNDRIAVPRGEPYVLRVKARDKSVVPSRVQLTLQPVGGDRTTSLLKEFSHNDFRHEFAVIDQPLSLQLAGGDDDVGPILLTPVDRPRIASLLLISQHPRQSAPENHPFNGGDADFSFLTKTRLTLILTANVPLSSVHLASQSAHPTQSDLHQLDATHFSIQWIHEAPARFDLELISADSTLTSLPVPLSIGLKPDQPPRVTMAYSGVRPRITARARIPLAIDARDDFGVIAASLALKDETPDPNDPAKLVPHESAQTLFPQPTAVSQPTASASSVEPQPLLQLKQTFDIAPLKLPNGALFSVTALATDDCYTGRQTAHSRTVTFRVVPPEELFREILQRQQAERVKFRKQMEEAEKIHDALRAAATPKDIADLARRHRAFQRETQRITGVLNDTFAEMQLNSLGSSESQTLMQNNVLTPMKSLQEELVSPQTAAIDAVSSADGTTIDGTKSQAVADREGQIVDRMKIILQQMAQWDSFVDVLNQLDGIIKMETQVKDSSEKLQHKETEGLFDK